MLSALLLLLADPTPPATRPIFGVAVAGDGNSLRVGDTRVRLFGIDAPEIDQVCDKPSGRGIAGKRRRIN